MTRTSGEAETQRFLDAVWADQFKKTTQKFQSHEQKSMLHDLIGKYGKTR